MLCRAALAVAVAILLTARTRIWPVRTLVIDSGRIVLQAPTLLMRCMPPTRVGRRLTSETYSHDGRPTLVRPRAERFSPGEHPSTYPEVTGGP